MERDSDIRKYLQPPWDSRRSPLVAEDQPWDDSMGGRLGSSNPDYQPVPGVRYQNGMSPEEQVDAWHKIMDHAGMEHAVCFPSHCFRVV